MSHKAKYIRVRFFKGKIRQWAEDPGDLDSDSKYAFDSDDEEQSSYPLLKKFLEPKGWVLEGEREDLEGQIEECLNGWLPLWGGQNDGWYIDNWIIRAINAVHAEYF